MHRKYNKLAVLSSILMLTQVVLLSGCKKFLEPDFKTNVTAEVVFSSDANAAAAVNGLYAAFATNASSNGEVTRSVGIAADELNFYSSSLIYDQFQKNQLLPDNATLNNIWSNYYNIIYQCNAIIENATTSAGMSAAYKIQVTGEARFFRAFCHFYLVNLFGPVPLITATAKDQTVLAPRSNEQEVYAQIVADLTFAMNSLPADYSVSGGNRTRANKWAAAALLSRTYLYVRDWANAEATASMVLANTSLYELQTSANINRAFVKNNGESILELDRSHLANYTNEGGQFLGYLSYSLVQYPMLPGLLNSFENGDIRKTNWIRVLAGVSTPNKYKLDSAPVTAADGENYQLLRLAEQYLIRAEARVMRNNVSGAQDDLSVIRKRAGFSKYNDLMNNADAMMAVENERRHELFCEWGHRWFDLKRWPSLIAPGSKTRADDVLGALKATWTSSSILFPIPKEPRESNPNLTQNEGYN